MTEKEVNKQPEANAQQTQTGDQSKNNIPFVQAPVNFESQLNKEIDIFKLPTKEQINESLKKAFEKQKEETIKIQAAQQADLEAKKQAELQASLQKDAENAQWQVSSFANISWNVAVANNDSAWRAADMTGVDAVKSAQAAVDLKAQADQNLVDNAYVRDLANQNAIAQTKNESLKLLNENYNTVQESFERLGASADKSILDSERQLAETMRRREENRQQTIDNQLQWQNEVARLSGYGLSDNMSTFIAGKMMNFIGKYDSDTFDIFAKWQTLTSNLREERKNLNNSIYSLVSNYVKQKDDLFIQAKAAENMAKYMVDGKSDYKNSLKQDIIIKAKEKNIELQNKLYSDIDNRLSIANKALTSEVNRIENERKVASSAIEQAIADGSIAHWTPEQKKKYAAMAGTTPAGIDNTRKASLAKVMAKLAVASGKDLSLVDTMTSEVMKLTNAGVDLQDAIKQVAQQNGMEKEFNKLMYAQETFNLDGIKEITQDFTDQASAQNFANTLKDKYDDIKVVEKNWKWTITGKEKWTGKELWLKELITGSGVDATKIQWLQTSTVPTTTNWQWEVKEEWGQQQETQTSTQDRTEDGKLRTDYNTNTSDIKTNFENAKTNIKNSSANKLDNIKKIVQENINKSVQEKRKEWISDARIKEIMKDESVALFMEAFEKEFWFVWNVDTGADEIEIQAPPKWEQRKDFIGLSMSDINTNTYQNMYYIWENTSKEGSQEIINSLNNGDVEASRDIEIQLEDIRKMFTY